MCPIGRSRSLREGAKAKVRSCCVATSKSQLVDDHMYYDDTLHLVRCRRCRCEIDQPFPEMNLTNCSSVSLYLLLQQPEAFHPNRLHFTPQRETPKGRPGAPRDCRVAVGDCRLRCQDPRPWTLKLLLHLWASWVWTREGEPGRRYVENCVEEGREGPLTCH